ncbi:hypothetical protein AMELA_G00234230 [Ameiurus melas]|uniref:Uncharacterized protein n=1 Tax=Ameiurus melas TaxID=219545 RepID=A0A7J6A0G1_AMEME|nr:hypothetical protein AMELA_G00234230 [Ameiurus melas]
MQRFVQFPASSHRRNIQITALFLFIPNHRSLPMENSSAPPYTGPVLDSSGYVQQKAHVPQPAPRTPQNAAQSSPYHHQQSPGPQHHSHLPMNSPVPPYPVPPLDSRSSSNFTHCPSPQTHHIPPEGSPYTHLHPPGPQRQSSLPTEQTPVRTYSGPPLGFDSNYAPAPQTHYRNEGDCKGSPSTHPHSPYHQHPCHLEPSYREVQREPSPLTQQGFQGGPCQHAHSEHKPNCCPQPASMMNHQDVPHAHPQMEHHCCSENRTTDYFKNTTEYRKVRVDNQSPYPPYPGPGLNLQPPNPVQQIITDTPAPMYTPGYTYYTTQAPQPRVQVVHSGRTQMVIQPPRQTMMVRRATHTIMQPPAPQTVMIQPANPTVRLIQPQVLPTVIQQPAANTVVYHRYY